MKRIILFWLLLSCAPVFAATRTAVTTGNWFTAATWGGTVPLAADIAVIPAGITVTLNLAFVGGQNTPWNNPGAIKVSGKLILNGNDPFFSNPCTLEVFSGGELNDQTFNNQFLFTQVSYLKVYAGGKATASPIASIIFNGNYVSEYDFPATPMNGPFTVTVASGQVTYAGTVLPLKLTGFTVQAVGADNRLNWQTTDEINTAGFVIERSSDGIYFSTIGHVPAAGLLLRNYYNFTDRAVLNGNNFYRLKMTDIDGRYTYSDVVRINSGVSSGLRLYLSPAQDMLYITTGTQGKLVIVNSGGRLVKTQLLPAGKSTVDVSTLGDGVYFIEQAGQRSSFIKVAR